MLETKVENGGIERWVERAGNGKDDGKARKTNSLKEVGRRDEEKNEKRGRQGENADVAGAEVVLYHVVVTPGDQIEVDQIHRLAVVFDGRDAIIPGLKLGNGTVYQVALEHGVGLAIAGEMVVHGADRAHLQAYVLRVTRRL